MAFKTIKNTKDILSLDKGDRILKSSLYQIIVDSKRLDSDIYLGHEYIIKNTPQQGINWIGNNTAPQAVIIKSKYGHYYQDSINEYAFKARKGVVNKFELANQVLINQSKYNYPIMYFVEQGNEWKLIGFFYVKEIKNESVLLAEYKKESSLQSLSTPLETTKATNNASCLKKTLNNPNSKNKSQYSTIKQRIPSKKVRLFLSNLSKDDFEALLNLHKMKTKTKDSNIVNNSVASSEENSKKTQIESLFNAVKSNDTYKIQELLQSSIDINVKDKDGWTALMFAASKNATDSAKILIKAGADLNAKDNCGWTALMDAVHKNSVDIVKLLIDAGANLDIKNNDETTAIMLTRGKDADTITKLFKDAGAKMPAS